MNEFWPDGKPEWCDGYIAGRMVDDRWIVLMPLTLDRARIAYADKGGVGEHW